MATKTKKAKKAPAVPAVHVTMATFDTGLPNYRPIREDVPIGDFTALTYADYCPRQGTPLYDATVHFIRHLEGVRQDDRVAIGLLLDESGSMGPNRAAVINSVNQFVDGMRAVDAVDPDNAGTVLAVIVTDGEENSSREFDQAAVAHLVGEKEQDGFTFIFLGANIDAWAAGRSMGLSGGATGQTVHYESTPVGTQSAMSSVALDSACYLADSSGYKASRSGSSMRSITEDGQESTLNLGAQPNSGSVGKLTMPQGTYTFGGSEVDVDEALRKAKEATKS